jgi:hypothetical protein
VVGTALNLSELDKHGFTLGGELRSNTQLTRRKSLAGIRYRTICANFASEAVLQGTTSDDSQSLDYLPANEQLPKLSALQY